MKGLDKYLTTDPNEGWYSYVESVYDQMTIEVSEKQEKQAEDWMAKLYYDRVDYKHAAAVISRALWLYRVGM